MIYLVLFVDKNLTLGTGLDYGDIQSGTFKILGAKYNVRKYVMALCIR